MEMAHGAERYPEPAQPEPMKGVREIRFSGRRFREDEEALSHIIEFTIALIIFVFVITGYLSAVNSKFVVNSPADSRRDENCLKLSEIIIGDTGMARTHAGNTTDWERLSPDELDRNLTRPGLALAGSGFGVLSEAKVVGLRNLTYLRMKSLLSLTNLDFNIEIMELNGTGIAFFGPSSDTAHRLSQVDRVVLLKNNASDTGRAVKLKFRLFQGISRRPLVRVNEIMYHPNGDKHEWLELYNPSDEAVNLSTLVLYTYTGNIFRDFPEGDSMILPGGGYAVLASNSMVWNEYAVSPTALRLTVKDGAFAQGGLPDTGATISIAGEGFREMSCLYNNTLGGDGNGKSLEWSVQHGDFLESLNAGGTPGSRNSVN